MEASVGDYSVVTHHGGRLQHFWQVWENLYCHPRVVQILRWGYRIPLQSNPPLSVYPIMQSGYDRQEKHGFLQDCVVQMLQKDAIYHLKDCTTPGFSSRLFLVPKPGKKWRPVIDLSVLNSHMHVPTFKMETAEIIRNSLTKSEWVVSIDLKDAYFHVPIHPDSQHLLRFHVDNRTYQFKALPFGLATAPLEFTRIVKEAKLVLQSRRIRVHQYLDDWLLRASSQHQCMSQTKELLHTVQELGFVINFEKSELVPTQKIDFLGYHFDLLQGKVFPTQKKLKILAKAVHGGRITNNPKVAYVPDRCTSIPRKDNTNGQAPHASISVVPEDTLAISPVSRPEDSGFKSSEKLSSVVEKPQKSRKGLSFTSSGTQYPYFHRCVKPGLGSSFRKSDSQWQLDRSGKIASYQCPRVEGGISGLKKLSKQNSRQEGSHSNRQRHCSQLSEQTRGNTLMGHVSPGLAHHGLLQSSKHTHKSQTHSGLPQCHSRQSLQEGQNNSDRVVTSSSNIHLNLPSLAQTNGRHVCHQDEPQTSTLCFSSPRCKCTEHRCIEHLLGGSGRLCLLSCSSHTKGHTENEHLQVQNDSSSTRVAHDALVLGSGESVNQTSIAATSLASSVKTTIQSQIPSESVVSESSCLAPGHHSEPLESFSEQVADRIKAPQRPSSRRVYESRWSIFELWCQQSQVVSSEPTISKIADFLNYLFTVKNLKPATIAGYRTAIADHLGHFGQEVSKSLDLNRLIASFYRDKPTANRGIPSWDLSLVLSALTKAPFEPLKDASLKILTFKTVFLMALASGKRRGEVHSWTYSSLRHKPHWKEVTISPSPAFLAKNQLASDGPDLLRPVVIPALKPFLSSDLTEDMTLCPVRALRYYLDRTNELRRGKNLLFISFKEGFDRDIMRSTISSWIKQTVLLAYQSSKADSQDLHIKAHDIRSMSASLAFKGGASLEQILGSCYWKSHNTFTTFYLKDVAWQSHDQSDYKLGPVVSAQHIVNV